MPDPAHRPPAASGTPAERRGDGIDDPLAHDTDPDDSKSEDNAQGGDHGCFDGVPGVGAQEHFSERIGKVHDLAADPLQNDPRRSSNPILRELPHRHQEQEQCVLVVGK
jgi:hypothetical protein